MHLCKYTEVLRKILPFKLLKTKLKAVFATPKKFLAGLIMTCLAFSTFVLIDMEIKYSSCIEEYFYSPPPTSFNIYLKPREE